MIYRLDCISDNLNVPSRHTKNYGISQHRQNRCPTGPPNSPPTVQYGTLLSRGGTKPTTQGLKRGTKGLDVVVNNAVTLPERAISNSDKDIVAAWTDTVSTKGLGTIFLRSGECNPHPGSAFSIHLPRHLMRAREHINTQEMRAVEQTLLYWGKIWSGKKVILNIDNRAVTYGIANRTIRGAPMTVLRRCLMLSAQFELDFEAQWIPTKVPTLADAL